jgi:hypothetical protein
MPDVASICARFAGVFAGVHGDDRLQRSRWRRNPGIPADVVAGLTCFSARWGSWLGVCMGSPRSAHRSTARWRLRTPAQGRRAPQQDFRPTAADPSDATLRRRRVLKLACLWASYVASLSLLGGIGYWLMMPPPEFDRPGTVWISDVNSMMFSRGSSFDVSMHQFGDGRQGIVIQNSGPQVVDLIVHFALGTSDTPDTTDMTPMSDGGFINTRSRPATGIDGVCFPPESGVQTWELICRFTLEPRAARSFYWNAAPTWVKHRGSRWAVQTPYVRLGNVSLPYLSDREALPKLRLTAHLRLPSTSAVMAGPALSWDWNDGTADFETTSLGQIAAPLVVDQAQQRHEEFLTFMIAAIIGAALGALPGLISYTGKETTRRSDRNVL